MNSGMSEFPHSQGISVSLSIPTQSIIKNEYTHNLSLREYMFFYNIIHVAGSKGPHNFIVHVETDLKCNKAINGLIIYESKQCENDAYILKLELNPPLLLLLKTASKINNAKLTFTVLQNSELNVKIKLPNGFVIKKGNIYRITPAGNHGRVLFSLLQENLVSDTSSMIKTNKPIGTIRFKIDSNKEKEIVSVCSYSRCSLSSFAIHFGKYVGIVQIYKKTQSNSWSLDCIFKSKIARSLFCSQLSKNKDCFVVFSHPKKVKYMYLSVVDPHEKYNPNQVSTRIIKSQHQQSYIARKIKKHHISATLRHRVSRVSTPHISAGSYTHPPTATFLERPRNFDGSRPSLDRLT